MFTLIHLTIEGGAVASGILPRATFVHPCTASRGDLVLTLHKLYWLNLEDRDERARPSYDRSKRQAGFTRFLTSPWEMLRSAERLAWNARDGHPSFVGSKMGSEPF